MSRDSTRVHDPCCAHAWSWHNPGMGFRTKQVHAGVEPDPTTGAILTPIFQSTTFVQESVDTYMEKGYSYARGGNPTVRYRWLLAGGDGGPSRRS